jgi:hypothetical protein
MSSACAGSSACRLIVLADLGEIGAGGGCSAERRSPATRSEASSCLSSAVKCSNITDLLSVKYLEIELLGGEVNTVRYLDVKSF